MQEHVVAAGAIPPGNAKGNPDFAGARPVVRQDIRLTPGGNKELTMPIQDLIGLLVKDYPILLFMKGTRSAPQCGFSYNTVELLNQTKVRDRVTARPRPRTYARTMRARARTYM